MLLIRQRRVRVAQRACRRLDHRWLPFYCVARLQRRLNQLHELLLHRQPVHRVPAAASLAGEHR